MQLSHEILLALAYVSQISDSDRVVRRFIESLNGLTPGLSFAHSPVIPAGVAEDRLLPISTLRSTFGYAVLPEGRTLGSAEQAVFRSAFQFLAVILENRAHTQGAERALRESEAHFEAMFEVASIGMAQADPQTGQFSRVNPKLCEITGYSREEMLTRDVYGVTHPEDRERDWEAFRSVVRGERPHYRTEKRYLRKDGSTIWVNVNMTVIRDGEGRPVRTMATIEDITDRKRSELENARLQERLVQAQKMESIGRLAGGVAHDFNNMLGVILGHAELILDGVGLGSQLYADLQEIRRAAEHSADLTRQLLAFARRQPVSPRVLDVNETVEGMLKMLRRLIGEDVDMVWVAGPNVWPLKLDPSQLDQILVNLCVNARDAITGTGKVTIETKNVVLDDSYCSRHAEAIPGDYVMLAVSDSGRGMDQNILGQIFEPFFTTKAVGSGTGLGLATVYGIVKQNSGFINVYSEPGHGASFKLYFPRDLTTGQQPSSDRQAEITGGAETVLLVEDEASHRNMAKRMLERLGYSVLSAALPAEAIRLAKAHTGTIDLLLTDVVMPEMNGRDLAKNILRICPAVSRLFMSGYSANVIAHHGVLDEGVHFIQKPFSLQELAGKIRNALKQRASDGRDGAPAPGGDRDTLSS